MRLTVASEVEQRFPDFRIVVGPPRVALITFAAT